MAGRLPRAQLSLYLLALLICWVWTSPQNRYCIHNALALPQEVLERDIGLSLAQGTGWGLELGQCQYLVALVTYHLKQSLWKTEQKSH